jgi:predicted ATP-dependent protease
MIERLREYIDELFAQAPPTKKTVEIKEEILQNLNEKYNDLRAEGKSEEAAYNIAVASIGDISELIGELKRNSAANDQSIDETQRLKEKQRGAILVSGAIMLYILSVIPIFILQNTIGLVLMFVFVAVATGMLIYNGMTRTQGRKQEETIAAEFKQWRETNQSRKTVYRSITSSLWAFAVVIYFLVSFWTGGWNLTWLIFLVAIAVNNIIRVLFEYRK